MDLTIQQVQNAIMRNALELSKQRKDTKVYALHLRGTFAGQPVTSILVMNVLIRRSYSILAVYRNGKMI